MSIIYKQDGFDVSDDGEQSKNIEQEAEIQLAIRKLPKQYQEILQMLEGGFTFREIECELKISPHTIRAAKESLRAII